MTSTRQTFSDKWFKNPDLAFAETCREGSHIFNWIVERNGWADSLGLRAALRHRKRVLDAGCGNGRVTALLRKYSSGEKTEIVGIDLVAAPVAAENLKEEKNVSFFTKDLLGDLNGLGRFDLVYCQEVLHHTANPRQAFKNLCSLLDPDDGMIAIYVYKQKAPMREYADDFVRDRIAQLPYEEAMKVCRQITELGRSLTETMCKVRIPSIDILGIEEGEYDVQRFLYHFFMKCFWNPDLSFEDNAVINYDWYHPQLCSRHTVEEVREWFREEGLEVIHENVDHYGITMHGKRNG